MFGLSSHDLPYRSIETCFVVCPLLYLRNRILILVQPQPYSVPKGRGGSTLSVLNRKSCFVRHSMINPTVVYSETCFVGCRVDCWLLIFAKSYLYPNPGPTPSLLGSYSQRRIYPIGSLEGAMLSSSLH